MLYQSLTKSNTQPSGCEPSPAKSGVLTFHRCLNYGSYWQARCLVEGLRTRGHNAVLLDYHSWRVKFGEWKCGLRPVLPSPVPVPDHLWYAAKILKFVRAFSALPRSAPFSLDRPEVMEPFDLVAVGSDEVWNLRHPWYGGYPLFFGDGIKAERLIAHAASFGNSEALKGLEKAWADRLRRFTFISVRDENSQRIIKSALGFEPDLVLDPCLQFPPLGDYRPTASRAPFVAVYGHNFTNHFGEQVRRWAKARRLMLISIGYRNSWADRQWLTAGPHDFARAIATADAVATNFFHGCVFALRFAKPFICEGSTYRSMKLRNLMKSVAGERHLASETTPASDFDSLLSEPLEPEILRRIERLRRDSSAYLNRAMA